MTSTSSLQSDMPPTPGSVDSVEELDVPDSPSFDIPSQHSGFRSSSVLDVESEPESSDSAGPWRPHVDWRREGSAFFPPYSRQSSPAHSRHSSPSHSTDPDITYAARVPIPDSPLKRSPSGSPQPEVQLKPEPPSDEDDGGNNFIRFAMRAEVRHRTEPIEALLTYWRRINLSRSALLAYVLSVLVAVSLFQRLVKTPDPSPGPDLVRVAGLASGFQPMIGYSEAGQAQIDKLEETGVAVWDLSESVRQSNMTSASIIVSGLDELSTGLRDLAVGMTKFFATVDGDVDSILIVMDWARRELSQLTRHVPSALSSAIENLSGGLARHTGAPDFGPHLHRLLGMTHADVSKATLARTFHEFLAVLEDSIEGELKHSLALLRQFEDADVQFRNLQRSVLREMLSQEAMEDAELASLWTKLFANCQFCGTATKLKKFQRNKDLLQSVRDRTVQNKLAVVQHNGRLQALRGSLDQLRQRIVSPLLRSENTSTLSIAEQIAGLEGTYNMLRESRDGQKSRSWQRLHATNAPTIGEDRRHPV